MDPQAPCYPSARRGWYVVGLLTAVYMLSFIDRYLLSLMIGPIKRSMSLSDFQIGLLLGPAFAVFYATMGMPIGWAADRVSRTRLIALGVGVWCLATAATGLAHGFGTLFVARVMVGAGEAVLAPCAISLIGDCFEPRRRGPPMSVYMSGTMLGAGTALIVGGRLVAWVVTLPPVHLPVVGLVQNWQALFIVVGLLGLVVNALMLVTPEPPRIVEERSDAPHEGAFAAFLAAHGAEYAWTVVGMAGVVTLGSVGFWNATLFERLWHWPMQSIGVWLGVMVIGGGVPGALIGGQLIRRMSARGTDAPLLIAQLGVAVMLPGYWLFGLAPAPALTLFGLWLSSFGQGVSTAAGPSAIVQLAPGAVRARAAALYWLVISLTGLLLGTTSVGFLADRLPGTGSLGPAIAIVASALLPISLIAFGMARRCVAGASRRMIAAVEKA